MAIELIREWPSAGQAAAGPACDVVAGPAALGRSGGWLESDGVSEGLHYNTARSHQGIAQHVPDGRHDGGHLTVADADRGRILRKPVLGA